MDLGSCKFYGAVKSKKPDTASGVDGNDDGGEVSVFVWEGAERRRDGQTCIKRLKVSYEIILLFAVGPKKYVPQKEDQSSSF